MYARACAFLYSLFALFVVWKEDMKRSKSDRRLWDVISESRER